MKEVPYIQSSGRDHNILLIRSCPQIGGFSSHLVCRSLLSGPLIDYRCDDSQIWVSASCLSSPNPDLLSSSETQVHLEIRSQKSAYLNQLNVSKPLVVFIPQKREDLRLYILV
jgi:hypothetical protein